MKNILLLLPFCLVIPFIANISSCSLAVLNNRWDWNGIIGTGQSLAVGGQASVATTDQPYHNLKLNLGNVTVPPWNSDNRGFKMVPLTEPIRELAYGYPSAYPCNLYGESFHTAMADQITALVLAAEGRDYISVHTVVGEAGQGIVALNKDAEDTGKTGRAYLASIFETRAIARLARTAGKTYGIGVIVMTAGETDAGNIIFEDELYQLWLDYNADLPTITGQTGKIPMFLSQQHAFPTGKNQRSASTLAQWRIGIDHPGEILCTGPKYQYEYVPDGVHLTARGYDRYGEKLGEIYFLKVVLGQDWQPLQPIAVTRSGRDITIRFHVPVSPLVWDNSLAAPHQTDLTEWAKGRGFEVRAGDERIEISSVEIHGDQVRITCAGELPAHNVIVGYAMTTDGAKPRGRGYRIGQLCDSDPFVGLATQSAQPNYCVSFELPVADL